jgi:predicted lipoprotein with Yx(FWY)xxD motif
MKQMMHNGAVRNRVPMGRTAVAAVAMFGLSSLLLTPGTSGAATSHAIKGVVISTAKSAQFGTILVDGKTLYTLAPSATACTTKCLKIWIPVLLPKGVTKATAGAGVSGAKLGTVKGAGGALQVTYGGKALYRFVLDTRAGMVKGNVTDTWGKWSDVVTKKASGATTTTTSPSGGGAGF